MNSCCRSVGNLLVRSSDAASAKSGCCDFATYASNSSRNFVIPESTGAMAASAKTQIVMPLPI